MRGGSCFGFGSEFPSEFILAFKKQLGELFLVARMLDFVDYMFPSDDSRQTYQRYIRVAKFLIQRHNILNICENFDGEKKGSKKFCISDLDEGSFFSLLTEEGPLLHDATS